jgi:quinohemoprotein amine dehydrogenase
MIRLNGVNLTPQQARDIVSYLSSFHGLSPEEARPAVYEAERRLRDEKAPNDGVRDACMACHKLGRVMSWRRSREEWDLLVKMVACEFFVSVSLTFRLLYDGSKSILRRRLRQVASVGDTDVCHSKHLVGDR